MSSRKLAIALAALVAVAAPTAALGKDVRHRRERRRDAAVPRLPDAGRAGPAAAQAAARRARGPATDHDPPRPRSSCTYRVEGKLVVRNPRVDRHGQQRAASRACDVKVSGRTSIGWYNEWDTVTTDADGDFTRHQDRVRQPQRQGAGALRERRPARHQLAEPGLVRAARDRRHDRPEHDRSRQRAVRRRVRRAVRPAGEARTRRPGSSTDMATDHLATSATRCCRTRSRCTTRRRSPPGVSAADPILHDIYIASRTPRQHRRDAARARAHLGLSARAGRGLPDLGRDHLRRHPRADRELLRGVQRGLRRGLRRQARARADRGRRDRLLGVGAHAVEPRQAAPGLRDRRAALRVPRPRGRLAAAPAHAARARHHRAAVRRRRRHAGQGGDLHQPGVLRQRPARRAGRPRRPAARHRRCRHSTSPPSASKS